MLGSIRRLRPFQHIRPAVALAAAGSAPTSHLPLPARPTSSTSSSSSAASTYLFATTASTTPLHSLQQRRHFVMPLPKKDQSDFVMYTEIDLPTESRIESIRRAGLAGPKDVWVGLEKVHGTNFGIYLLNGKDVRYAKRSGIMDPNENFFGYHVLCDQFSKHIRQVAELVRSKYKLSMANKVILNGELFGAKYKHPDVPKSNKWCVMPNGKRFPISGVLIQKEPFPQYSPELHFFAFDLKYSVSGEERDMVNVPYDDMVEICSQVEGLLYAKAIVRGTLDQCLAFDVENFMTPLPALLGLGNYPLEGNWAEGLILKHVLRGTPAIDSIGAASILKIRCSAFMELKHPNKQKELKETFFDTVRAAAVKRAGTVIGFADALMPQMEAAANALLVNHVSEGRLSNTISKVGRDALVEGRVTKAQISLMLAKDALKDFLKDIDDPSILNTSISFRKALIKNCYFEAVKLVDAKWDHVTGPEEAA